MALITCPECKAYISSLAFACPHCGAKMTQIIPEHSETLVCAECAKEYSVELPSCPSCGYPTIVCNAQVQKRKLSKRGRIIAAVFIAVVLCLFGVNVYNSVKSAEMSKYYNNMADVSDAMIQEVNDAARTGELIRRVWHNAVYGKQDPVTDKYTMDNGIFWDEFSAMGNLYGDEEFKAAFSDLYDGLYQITELMKELANPPKEYEDAYSALKEFYDDYLTLILALNDSSGSLTTFYDNLIDAEADAYTSWEKALIYLESAQ